ncbi:Plasmodium falciparum CPW-WPC domain containing protein, putative [Babesia bigemina]|uniref:Plasmodium falciparum CPW-WPC domain containing protein, putative n=1 Tax=Babesia bigemina TaxID=5866 RepID=A0A061D5Z4_BABBI|nr:Plasmodium falciparum CPW-WPC domain containing protein, putative [Babesia bigemina]CDR96131.1 Plasmodium falciparum CPW-WPC domain containing protein, putative [Babesia bigemina]|eukprot:XP_012768317.1 Plasmodium falciparum CPW-WPC domain containing protein, putative [Babesia bigemina]
MTSLVFIVATILGCVSQTDGSRIRKSYTDTQLDLFKDIAKNLKEESEHIPTTAQVVENMKRLDDAEFKRLDERIAKETAQLSEEHSSCGTVNYERDYSHACPSEWTLQADGSCWGEHYTGPCEAIQTFKLFTKADKTKFEHRCCAFWPARGSRKRSVSTSALIGGLHGIVDPHDGHIVPPRQ